MRIPFPKIKSWSDVERLRRSIPECERKIVDKGQGKIFRYEVLSKDGGPPIAQFRDYQVAGCFALMHETVQALRTMVIRGKTEVVKLRQTSLTDYLDGEIDGPV